MSPDDYTWLQYASPAAFATLGVAVYWITGRQDRAEATRGE